MVLVIDAVTIYQKFAISICNNYSINSQISNIFLVYLVLLQTVKDSQMNLKSLLHGQKLKYVNTSNH